MYGYSSRSRERELREALCEAGRRMHAQGFAAGSDGNLSIRLDDEQILITPSGFSKGHLDPEQLVTVTPDGDLVASFHPARRNLKPSSETNMHLEAYRQRPDVQAVIHAHPPMGIACTVAGVRLDRCVLPEIIYHLGAVPTAPYATPGTPEGAEAVRDLVGDHDALLLDHHGSLTLGKDIFQALMRLEWIEQAAKVMLAARSVGTVEVLPEENVDRLQNLRASARGSAGPFCSPTGETNNATEDHDKLVRAVTESVLQALADRGVV